MLVTRVICHQNLGFAPTAGKKHYHITFPEEKPSLFYNGLQTIVTLSKIHRRPVNKNTA